MPEPLAPLRPALEHAVYLVRIWHEPGDTQPVWRASVVAPHGTERRYFAHPEVLLAYLRAQVLGEAPQER
ncbi:hypothetical protein E7T06_04995 [Deinococcus sp. Arct2-2]|uniref:hypothetical protein n=1 Tax=Deinococcus sp. Arct2-2 TaxID=2568653 RepID=UPI0010A37A84|nr:hypothetical protein [Deinococcus sp. Arct2-2]THF70919.1 hypothetical protein E7T06_04995 [Deinococcus sp. Arct2-2]